MTSSRSIASLLAAAAAELAPVSSSPGLDAELLLARASLRTRAQLLAHADEPVPDAASEVFRRLLARRATGEPLAYILGTRGFWSLELAVSRAVLVPRPETELLVELALAAGDKRAADADTTMAAGTEAAAVRVLDLGTGSGAIALAIARERPRWRVTATDESAAALDVARHNAANNDLAHVRFVAGDWFAALGSELFDVIVSNPPYLAADDSALADAALRFEPRRALTDERDGLQDLFRIAGEARAHLEDNGVLLLEHAPAQAPALRAKLVACGYRHVRSHRDLAGRERATEAHNSLETPHGSLSNNAR